MIYIGIDTGVNTGFAAWNEEEKTFKVVRSVKIHVAMDIVKGLLQKGEVIHIRVEDPRKRTWFGTEKMTREQERSRLQGVGSVKRDAVIWEDFLKDIGASYEMVAPKNNITKISHETFVHLTKWEGRTNEHGRDAAMLVFGF